MPTSRALLVWYLAHVASSLTTSRPTAKFAVSDEQVDSQLKWVDSFLWGDELAADADALVGVKKLYRVSDPDVVFKHVQKTGGNTVKDLLMKSVKDDKIRFVSEHATGHLVPEHYNSSAFFTVSSVRNPCDYYLSFWSYCARSGYMRMIDHDLWKELIPVSLGKNTTQDFANFRRWLHYYNDLQHGAMDESKNIGAMTSLFAAGLLTDLDIHRKRLFGYRAMGGDDRERIHDGFKKFNANDVSCWIHTETLLDDSRTCLKKYEQQGGSVDWVLFEQYLEELHSQIKNNSVHAKCDEFFDDDAKEYIMNKDRMIFEKFGYKQCCGGKM